MAFGLNMREILKQIRNRDMVSFTYQMEKNGQVSSRKIYQMALEPFIVVLLTSKMEMNKTSI